MSRRLLLLPRARIAIDSAIAWMVGHWSKRVAIQWKNGITKKLKELQIYPDRYPIYEFENSTHSEIREAAYEYGRTVHRIFYSYDSETVTVHLICNAAQDVTESFE